MNWKQKQNKKDQMGERKLNNLNIQLCILTVENVKLSCAFIFTLFTWEKLCILPEMFIVCLLHSVQWRRFKGIRHWGKCGIGTCKILEILKVASKLQVRYCEYLYRWPVWTLGTYCLMGCSGFTSTSNIEEIDLVYNPKAKNKMSNLGNNNTKMA